jgi:copper chaperone
MDATTISISGMSCSHCVNAVQKALATVPGVTVQEVTVGSATIVLEPGVGSLSAAEAAVDGAGFDVVKGRVLNVAAAAKLDEKSDA